MSSLAHVSASANRCSAVVASFWSRASSLSATVAVRNLALFTGYSGTDPETNQAGRGGNTGANATFDQNFAEAVDVFGLPLQRRFSLSLRLGF